MLGLVLLVSLASSFPLPTVDGKPLSVTEKQKQFRLPVRFEKEVWDVTISEQSEVYVNVQRGYPPGVPFSKAAGGEPPPSLPAKHQGRARRAEQA